MSLLDESNTIVRIYPQVLGTDSDGNPQYKPSPTPVDVPAMVWPVSSDEALVSGQQVGDLYRVRPKRGASFPAGPWSLVEWDGRTWDVVGDPLRHKRGKATQRTTMLIRTQKPQEVT